MRPRQRTTTKRWLHLFRGLNRQDREEAMIVLGEYNSALSAAFRVESVAKRVIQLDYSCTHVPPPQSGGAM
jgi:hypothetical protein